MRFLKLIFFKEKQEYGIQVQENAICIFILFQFDSMINEMCTKISKQA